MCSGRSADAPRCAITAEAGGQGWGWCAGARQAVPGARAAGVAQRDRGHQRGVRDEAHVGHQPAVTLIQAQNHWKGDPSRQRFSPQQLRGLAPAGRLDIDSTGLLVLTQDGRVARQLIGEDSVMEKEYLVRVIWQGPQGDVTQNVQTVFPREQLARLRHALRRIRRRKPREGDTPETPPTEAVQTKAD